MTIRELKRHVDAVVEADLDKEVEIMLPMDHADQAAKTTRAVFAPKCSIADGSLLIWMGETFSW